MTRLVKIVAFLDAARPNGGGLLHIRVGRDVRAKTLPHLAGVEALVGHDLSLNRGSGARPDHGSLRKVVVDLGLMDDRVV